MDKNQFILTDQRIDVVRCCLDLPQSSDDEYVTWSKADLRTFARAILQAQSGTFAGHDLSEYD